MTHRRGDWMQTYTGQQFWPVDPRIADIDMTDVAHALGMTCRFAGHCLRFYSVAEHSVLLARKMPTLELKRWALIHDAPEAYIGDLVHPLKKQLPEYKIIENRIMATIAQHLGMTSNTVPNEIKEADAAILFDEVQQNMTTPPKAWDLPTTGIGVRLYYWRPVRAGREYQKAFETYFPFYQKPDDNELHQQEHTCTSTD